MPSSEPWRVTKHCLIAGALSFVNGYTDAICATRWHVFVTTMTSNIVFVGKATIQAVQSNGFGLQTPTEQFNPAWYYALIILTFCFGIVAWRFAEHRYPDRGASTVGIPFAFLMVIMELFLLFYPRVRDWHMTYFLLVLAYAPMFGVLNAACQAGRLACTTCTGTGHIVKVVDLTVKSFLTKQELKSSDRAKRKVSLSILAGIFLGVCAGVIVYLFLGNGSQGALMPVGPAIATLFWLHDHLARPSSLVKKAQALQRKVAAAAAACGNGSDDEQEDGESMVDFESSLSDSDCSEDGSTPHSGVAPRQSSDLEQGAVAGIVPSAVAPTLLTSLPLSAEPKGTPV